MRKEELEEKIKNKESVWYAAINYGTMNENHVPPILKELKLDENYFIEFKEKLGFDTNQYGLFKKDFEYAGYNIKDIFSTKAQAQHYLNNVEVERIERLPFITYEEFIKGKEIEFFDSKGNKFTLEKGYDIIKDIDIITLWVEGCKNIKLQSYYEDLQSMECTEENFYKMYELCKQYFNGKLIKEKKEDEI